MLNKKNTPPDAKIKPSKIRAQSATGTNIPIVGQIDNLPITIDGQDNGVKNIQVNSGKPDYAILGADFLTENPEILQKHLTETRRRQHFAVNMNHSSQLTFPISSSPVTAPIADPQDAHPNPTRLQEDFIKIRKSGEGTQ